MKTEKLKNAIKKTFAEMRKQGLEIEKMVVKAEYVSREKIIVSITTAKEPEEVLYTATELMKMHPSLTKKGIAENYTKVYARKKDRVVFLYKPI